MANTFPTSLNTFTNPGSTTYTDDTGFELDVVVSNLNDAAEAEEAKIGIGASTPVANTVLRGTGTGTSAWGSVATGDIAAHAITDTESVYAGSLITTTNTTYVDMTSMSLSWTSTVTEDLIVDFVAAIGNTVLGRAINIALSLDGAAETNANDVTATVASAQIPTPVQGAFEAVAAGAHTIKVRWLTGGDTARAQSRSFRVLRVKR